MNRSILLVTLLATSTIASATSWYQIAETPGSAPGQKYTIEVDIDSINVGPYDKTKPDDGLFIAGLARYLTDGKETTRLASAVDVEECQTRNEGAIKTEWPDGKTSIDKWQKQGERAIDRRAKFLCDFVNGTVGNIIKSKPKKEPKKIWM